jgi:prepilin signal peptidase PulO-like enzyme (type II secretory pathway)
LVQIFLGTRQIETFSVLVSVASVAAVTVCAATDSFSGYVFDAVTLPAGVAILTFAWFQHHLPAAAAGALTAGTAMGLLYVVTLGRGIGLGDVKLACCIGSALGAYDSLLSLGVAFVSGGVYAAYLLLTRRRSRGDEMRFAPYLAAGMAALSVYRSC